MMIALIALYFLLPPALTASARWLVRADAPTQADVIIALGGDVRSLREREAAALYVRGLARKLVVSGQSYTWGVHTGEVAKQYLMSLGIPESDIYVLRESWNTRQEATGLAGLMREQDWKSAIIVTSPYHSRRALYTFNRYVPGYTFYSVPVPAQSPEWRPERWWARRGDAELTVREFLAWGNTVVGGLR